MARFLIIGGSSLIGSNLFRMNYSYGDEVRVTTRSEAFNCIPLDLRRGDFSDVLSFGASYVFFCAAMTGVKKCEETPSEAFLINVTNTLSLISSLVEKGAFVVWLSSSMVFDGQTLGNDEFSEYSPATMYGQLKVYVERHIMKDSLLSKRVAIVRPSKVVSRTHGITADFIRHFELDQSVNAFCDLLLSPVSVAYVCGALQCIARCGNSGVFHLSGEMEFTYVQYAGLLSDRFGFNRDLINPISSDYDSSLDVLFRPKHPSLSMSRTTELLGLSPEPINLTLDELFCQE